MELPNSKMLNRMAGDSMLKTYYPTHTRMGAWFVGVLLGYMLHNLKGKSIKVPKVEIDINFTLKDKIP